MGEAKRKKLAQQAASAGAPAIAAQASTGALSRDELTRLDRETEALLKCGEGSRALPLCQALLAAVPGNRAARNRLRMAYAMALQSDAERRFVPPGDEGIGSVLADRIDVVTFHVDAKANAARHAANTDYVKCLRALVESATMAAPGCSTILLTDERTAFPDDMGFDRIVRYNLNSALPMYERMRAQGLYLGERRPERVTAFVDSDVLVNRALDEVFSGRWDVGLTWRDGIVWDAPLNGGVIFVGTGTGPARFFAQALAQYGRLADSPEVAACVDGDLRAWWGDQMALAGLVGYPEFHRRPPGQLLLVSGVAVKFFPCEQYNFEDAALAGEGDVSEKYLLHFKGENKVHIPRYLAALRARTA